MRGEDDTGDDRQGGVGRSSPDGWHPSRADYVFEALSDRRRRDICRILRTTTDRAIEDLAMDVAAHESGDDERTVTNHEWETVFASLYHAQIPKLTDLGVVTFDRATGVVNPGPRFDQVVDVLSVAERVLTVDEES